MKQFYDFLDSIKQVDPVLVEGIKKAHKVIYEDLATEEVLDDAEMKLSQNTEEKIAETLPPVEPTPEESADLSEQDIPMDEIEEDISIDGLDELVEE